MDKTGKNEVLTYQSDALNTALMKIEMLGFPLPQLPEVEDKEFMLPSNLASLTDIELSEHLARWTNLISVSEYEISRAETNLTEAGDDFALASDEELLQMPSGEREGKVTIRKAQVSQLSRIKKLKERMRHFEAVRDMLKSLNEGYTRKYAAISREVEHRKRRPSFD